MPTSNEPVSSPGDMPDNKAFPDDPTSEGWSEFNVPNIDSKGPE